MLKKLRLFVKNYWVTRDYLDKQQKNLLSHLDQEILELKKENIRFTREILWANIFHDSISESEWLIHKNFAPGRWAVGYQFLFVLYSVLSKAEPKSILELGLGQSTHMITQYAAANPDVQHIVTEQNAQWIEFFRKDHDVAPNTTIKLLDCVESSYKDDPKVNMYCNFKEEVGNQKYDLICIDAPTQNGISKYHRVDVLSILPDSLAEDFVIMLDDFQRPAEKNTAKEISAILKENGIPFTVGTYKGEKELRIWCSEKMGYFRTL